MSPYESNLQEFVVHFATRLSASRCYEACYHIEENSAQSVLSMDGSGWTEALSKMWKLFVTVPLPTLILSRFLVCPVMLLRSGEWFWRT